MRVERSQHSSGKLNYRRSNRSIALPVSLAIGKGAGGGGIIQIKGDTNIGVSGGTVLPTKRGREFRKT